MPNLFTPNPMSSFSFFFFFFGRRTHAKSIFKNSGNPLQQIITNCMMFDDPLCDGLFLCVFHLNDASAMGNTYSETFIGQ